MPNDPELEQIVLGAMLLESDGANEGVDLIRAENTFYQEANRIIFRAIVDLVAQGKPADIMTVTKWLEAYTEPEKRQHHKRQKRDWLTIAGGAFYVSQLTNRVASAANLEEHCRILQQLWIKREIIRICSGLVDHSFDPHMDPIDLLSNAERDLINVGDSLFNRIEVSLREALPKSLRQIEVANDPESKGITGVPCGYPAIDSVTGGWQRSDLIILAARPGMGKTAFMLNTASNAAKSGYGVGIFSLEMTTEQLVNRMLSFEAEVNSHKLRSGGLTEEDWEKLSAATARIEKLPVFIDDTPALPLFALRSKARKLVSVYGVKLLVIDYLQLMSGNPDSRQNREQQISEISRGLKSIAKELDVPVIALSQLSRAVETRGGEKRPQLSDLRESGAIEQDADVVTFLYRPDYYTHNSAIEETEVPGKTEFIIAKHRQGSLVTPEVYFDAQYTKFRSTPIDNDVFPELPTSRLEEFGKDFLNPNEFP